MHPLTQNALSNVMHLFKYNALAQNKNVYEKILNGILKLISKQGIDINLVAKLILSAGTASLV